MSNGGYGPQRQFPQQSQKFGGNMGAPGSFGNGANGYGGGYGQGPGMDGTQQQGAPWRSMNKPMALGPDPTLNRFPQVSSLPNDFMTGGYQGGNQLGIDPTLNRFRQISGPANDMMTNGYQGQMPQTSGLHPYQPQQPPAPTYQQQLPPAPSYMQGQTGGNGTATGTVRDPVTGEWSVPKGGQAQNIYGNPQYGNPNAPGNRWHNPNWQGRPGNPLAINPNTTQLDPTAGDPTRPGYNAGDGWRVMLQQYAQQDGQPWDYYLRGGK